MSRSTRFRRTVWAAFLLVSAGGLITAGAGHAQQTAPKAATPGAGPEAVEPAALAALDKMGAYLRTLETFAVHAETATDELLPSGQKVQISGATQLMVRRPDRLRAEVDSDKRDLLIVFDGKTLTINDGDAKAYTSIAAPGTIREMLETADSRYGVEIPLVDLFLWGTDQARVQEIRSATLLGTTRVNGAACDHFAFSQEDIDWQVWIEAGPTPLPRKLVITTKDTASQPQHMAVLDWDLAPKFDDGLFTFVPPEGAQRVGIAETRKSGRSP